MQNDNITACDDEDMEFLKEIFNVFVSAITSPYLLLSL